MSFVSNLSLANYIQVGQSQLAKAGKPQTIESLLGSEARAQRVVKLSASQRPFAVGSGLQSWLDEAQLPPAGPRAVSSLYELPQGYSPSQAGVTGEPSFDQSAEDVTKQYLDGLSANAEDSQRPFAVGSSSQGWLEAASSLMVWALRLDE